MNAENGIKNGKGKIVEVDFAIEFQESIKESSVLRFVNDDLKKKIQESDPNKLIVVTSTITSPKTIEDVEDYDEAFLDKNL